MSFALHHQIGIRNHPSCSSRSHPTQQEQQKQNRDDYKRSRAIGPTVHLPPGGTAAACAGSRSFSIVQHLRATAANASPPSVSRIQLGDNVINVEEQVDEMDARRVEMMLSTLVADEEEGIETSQAFHVPFSIRVPDMNTNKNPARRAGEWIIHQTGLPPSERAYTYWAGAYITVLVVFNAVLISMIRILGMITARWGEGVVGWGGERFKWLHHGLLAVAVGWLRCKSVL